MKAQRRIVTWHRVPVNGTRKAGAPFQSPKELR
jgi:hypothetical protein